MSNQPNKLPKEIIEEWPEIFGDVDLIAVPAEYIKGLQVSFENGKVFDIDIEPDDEDSSELVENTIDQILSDFFDEYDEDVIDIDFQINTAKVIRDAKKMTRDLTS